MKKVVSVLFIILIFSFSAFSQEKNVSQDAARLIDRDTRDLWTTRHELFVYGGNYFGDSLKNSYAFGADYIYHFTKNLGLGGAFCYSTAKFEQNIYYSEPGFFKSDNMYIVDAEGMFSFPLIYSTGRNLIQADFFISAGAGAINVNERWEPHGFLGGGMKMYLGIPWLALRVDVRDTFHPTKIPGSSQLDQDVLFVFGASFQIPPRVMASPQGK